MKNIVIVTDAWFPQVNGVVVSLEKTRQLLEKEGYRVTVIHPGLFLNIPLLFFYPEINLSLFPRTRVKRLLLTMKPDRVHIATEGPLGLAARSVCRKYKIPFNTSYHTNFQQYIQMRVGKWVGVFVQRYLRWFHNASEKTLVSTPSMKTVLEQRRFAHVVLWPLGVDTDLFVRKVQTESNELPKPLFIYFGRIAMEKGVEEFLACDLPGTKLVIGDGPSRARLQKKYESAVFLGYKKGQELVDALSLCDVFVFPSRTDTFGLVVLEALSCGIPVAAHNVLGPKDIITQGVDGYLSDDLKEAALACLNMSREACRNKALQFSWQHSVQAFISHL